MPGGTPIAIRVHSSTGSHRRISTRLGNTRLFACVVANERFRDELGGALQDTFPALKDSIAEATVDTEPMEPPVVPPAGPAPEKTQETMDVDTAHSVS